MIDFRYHIVSLVSVFLALAVGIVLGAGPLKGEIGTTLQSEVAALRTDKAQLNDQLNATRTGLEQRDAYLAATQDRVLAGVLTDRSVAVVVLPDADGSITESVVKAVDAAGGRVTATVSVSKDWVTSDDSVAGARDAAVEKAAEQAGIDLPSPTADARDGLLASLVARSAPVGAGGPGGKTAAEGLGTLADAGLVSVDTATDAYRRAELVVVVAGVETDGDEQARTAAATQWVGLATALDSAARGAVMASDLSVPSDGVAVLTTLRADAAAKRAVSGVDDAGSPVGVSSVVFALAEQEVGKTGQYGTGSGTDAGFAPVPGS